MQTVQKIVLGFEPKTKNLLPVLRKINSIFGYVGQEDAEFIAEYFSVSPAKVFETASFYDLIKIKKPLNLEIKVCSSTNCSISGAYPIIQEIENFLGVKEGDEFNPKIKLETVSCLGRCGQGPVMIVNSKVFEKVTKEKIHEILKPYL